MGKICTPKQKLFTTFFYLSYVFGNVEAFIQTLLNKKQSIEYNRVWRIKNSNLADQNNINLVGSLHFISIRRFYSTEQITKKEELLSILQDLCPNEKEVKHKLKNTTVAGLKEVASAHKLDFSKLKRKDDLINLILPKELNKNAGTACERESIATLVHDGAKTLKMLEKNFKEQKFVVEQKINHLEEKLKLVHQKLHELEKQTNHSRKIDIEEEKQSIETEIQSIEEELKTNSLQIAVVGTIKMPSIVQSLGECGVDDFDFIVRTHYEHIYNFCSRHKRSAIIGTPGIAKSVSILYPMLKHFIKYENDIINAPPVVLQSGESGFLFFNGTCYNFTDFMGSSTSNLRTRVLKTYPELLNLVDSPDPSVGHLVPTLSSSIPNQTIITSSPMKKRYYEFVKQGGSLSIFVMPVWNIFELLRANTHVMSLDEQEIYRRYEMQVFLLCFI